MCPHLSEEDTQHHSLLEDFIGNSRVFQGGPGTVALPEGLKLSFFSATQEYTEDILFKNTPGVGSMYVRVWALERPLGHTSGQGSVRAALSLFPKPLLLVLTFIPFTLTQCEFIHPMALTTTHTL